MSRIKSKDTAPELLVRKLLFSLGKRYRIHYKLTGKPDIVFLKHKIVIFIHGCYWHGHGCKVDHISKSNTEFWSNKIIKNKERDKRIKKQLKKDGWRVFTLWECKILDDPRSSCERILKLLNRL